MYMWYFQLSSDIVDLLPQKLLTQLMLVEQADEDGGIGLQKILRNRLVNSLSEQIEKRF